MRWGWLMMTLAGTTKRRVGASRVMLQLHHVGGHGHRPRIRHSHTFSCCSRKCSHGIKRVRMRLRGVRRWSRQQTAIGRLASVFFFAEIACPVHCIVNVAILGGMVSVLRLRFVVVFHCRVVGHGGSGRRTSLRLLEAIHHERCP